MVIPGPIIYCPKCGAPTMAWPTADLGDDTYNCSGCRSVVVIIDKTIIPTKCEHWMCLDGKEWCYWHREECVHCEDY